MTNAEPQHLSAVPSPVEAEIDSSREPGDEHGPFPVEDWLEQVATITSEISRETLAAVDADGHETTTVKVGPMTSLGDNDDGKGRGAQRSTKTFPAGHGGSNGAATILGRTLPLTDGLDDDVGYQVDGRVLIGLAGPGNDADQIYFPVATSRPRRPRSWKTILGLAALVAFLIAIGGGSGYAIASYLPEKWTAEAEVVLEPGQAQVDRYLATQLVLIQSSTILDRAVEDLPVDRKYVEDGLKVFPIEASSALGVEFVDTDPSMAKAVVDAVLASFMVEVETASADFSSAIYEERIDELTSQRNRTEKLLALMESENVQAEADELPLPYPAEVRRLALESEQLLSQISTLESALLADEVASVQRTDAFVVTTPRVLVEPTWPKPLAFTALGLLVGSVVAALLLFLLATRRSASLVVV